MNPQNKTDNALMVRLYLALLAITKDWVSMAEEAGNREADSDADYLEALAAIEEFKFEQGPMPDWAIRTNWRNEPVAGSQLFTKNGRRMGNAHIVEVRPLDSPGQAGFVYEYVCISDAGNEFTLSHGSLFELFEIGDYISDVARIKKHFLRS